MKIFFPFLSTTLRGKGLLCEFIRGGGCKVNEVGGIISEKGKKEKQSFESPFVWKSKGVRKDAVSVIRE